MAGAAPCGGPHAKRKSAAFLERSVASALEEGRIQEGGGRERTLRGVRTEMVDIKKGR